MIPLNNNLWGAVSNVTVIDVKETLEANNIPVEQLRIFNSGWDSFVYLLNETQIIQIAKRKNVALRIREEIQFLKLLQGRFGVDVPMYNLVLECNLAGGLLVSYSFIKGNAISVHDPTSLKAIIDVVKFCSEFHKISQKNDINLSNSVDLKVFQQKAIEAQKVIRDHLSSAENYLLDRVININIKTSEPVKVCIHNDLRPAHILQNDSQIGVIDWKDFAWAMPWLDFLWLWIYWGDSIYPILSCYYQDWNSSWEKNIAVVGLWKCALEYCYGLQTNDTKKIRIAKFALNHVLTEPRHPIYRQFYSRDDCL